MNIKDIIHKYGDVPYPVERENNMTVKVQMEKDEETTRLLIDTEEDEFVEVTHVHSTGSYNVNSHEGAPTYYGNDEEIAKAVTQRIVKDMGG